MASSITAAGWDVEGMRQAPAAMPVKGLMPLTPGLVQPGSMPFAASGSMAKFPAAVPKGMMQQPFNFAMAQPGGVMNITPKLGGPFPMPVESTLAAKSGSMQPPMFGAASAAQTAPAAAQIGGMVPSWQTQADALGFAQRQAMGNQYVANAAAAAAASAAAATTMPKSGSSVRSSTEGFVGATSASASIANAAGMASESSVAAATAAAAFAAATATAATTLPKSGAAVRSSVDSGLPGATRLASDGSATGLGVGVDAAKDRATPSQVIAVVRNEPSGEGDVPGAASAEPDAKRQCVASDGNAASARPIDSVLAKAAETIGHPNGVAEKSSEPIPDDPQARHQMWATVFGQMQECKVEMRAGEYAEAVVAIQKQSDGLKRQLAIMHEACTQLLQNAHREGLDAHIKTLTSKASRDVPPEVIANALKIAGLPPDAAPAPTPGADSNDPAAIAKAIAARTNAAATNASMTTQDGHSRKKSQWDSHAPKANGGGNGAATGTAGVLPTPTGPRAPPDSTLPDGAKVSCKGLPLRPGKPPCHFYVTTKDCKLGPACSFDHSEEFSSAASGGSGQGAAAKEAALSLNAKGLPLRSGTSNCELYMRTGSCHFGATCKWNHPENVVPRDK